MSAAGKTKQACTVFGEKEMKTSVGSLTKDYAVNIKGTFPSCYKISYNHKTNKIASVKTTAKIYLMSQPSRATIYQNEQVTAGTTLTAADPATTSSKSAGGTTDNWYVVIYNGKKRYLLQEYATVSAYVDSWNGYVPINFISITSKEGVAVTTKTVKTATGIFLDSSGASRATGSCSVGQVYHVSELKNGRYFIVDGVYTNLWIPAIAFEESQAKTQATAPTASATPVATNTNTSNNTPATVEPQTIAQNTQQYGYEEPQWTAIDPNYDISAAYAYLEANANIADSEYDDEYYRNLSFKWFNALGYPPKYNMDIDLQYPGAETDGKTDAREAMIAGRVFTKTFMANPPILSICPGTVKMFPNLLGSKRDSELEQIINAATGMGTLQEKIKGDETSLFSGKLYHFEADTKTYSYYLNALCRACAILLKIGDQTAPWTGAKLKDFDYAYWYMKRNYAKAVQGDDGDKSLFKNFSTLFTEPSKIYTSLVEDTAYLNFFLNGAETSISETISTDVEDSPLAGMFNTVNSLSNTINYFTSSGFSYGSDEESIMSTIREALGTGSTTIDGILDLGKNFMNGGKVVLPKMVSGAHYGKSISCNTKFVSPYGDAYSVFIKCIVPVCHLLALALPKQLSDNMYTYPFLVRAFQVGQFSCDLGIINNLVINRGGPDETSWSINGLATEWDVSFEITPLVDELMMSGTNHPGLFLKNENLIDYLGNYCGFDLYANNASTKSEMVASFIKGFFTGIPRSIENYASDKLFNKLAGLSQVAWGA